MRGSRSAAFSLLELIVSIAILTLLAAIVAPVTSQVIQSNRLSTCAANLASQLNAARTLAIRMNQPVEIRFYQYADREIPGAPLTYRSYQLWLNGNPYQGIVTLEPGVIISTKKGSGGESWSPILDSQLNTLGGDQPLPANLEIPRAASLTNARYSFFQFRPNGSTNLPSARHWAVTLLAEKDSASATLPANFISILIEPLNGGVRTLSP